MSKALGNMGYEELLAVTEKLQGRNADLEIQNASLESRLSNMQFQLDQMKRLLFGAKRERFVPARDEKQMPLPFDAEEEPKPEQQKQTITYSRTKSNRKNHPGRIHKVTLSDATKGALYRSVAGRILEMDIETKKAANRQPFLLVSLSSY
jgi:hypothetical protein